MEKVSLDWPVWYQPQAPLGSAVRYVAGLGSKFNWVGLYVLDGNALRLGPFIGDASPHRRIPVRYASGEALGHVHSDLNRGDVTLWPNAQKRQPSIRSLLATWVRDSRGRPVAQLVADSLWENAFSPETEEAVRKVARELGELWPKQRKPKRRSKR